MPDQPFTPPTHIPDAPGYEPAVGLPGHRWYWDGHRWALSCRQQRATGLARLLQRVGILTEWRG